MCALSPPCCGAPQCLSLLLAPPTTQKEPASLAKRSTTYSRRRQPLHSPAAAASMQQCRANSEAGWPTSLHSGTPPSSSLLLHPLPFFLLFSPLVFFFGACSGDRPAPRSARRTAPARRCARRPLRGDRERPLQDAGALGRSLPRRRGAGVVVAPCVVSLLAAAAPLLHSALRATVPSHDRRGEWTHFLGCHYSTIRRADEECSSPQLQRRQEAHLVVGSSAAAHLTSRSLPPSDGRSFFLPSQAFVTTLGNPTLPDDLVRNSQQDALLEEQCVFSPLILWLVALTPLKDTRAGGVAKTLLVSSVAYSRKGRYLLLAAR